MAKYKLGDIAPIKQGIVPDSDNYWLLNLDMVESNTGRIIDYICVLKREIGTSTVSFDKGNVLYSKLRPYLNKVVIPEKPGYATSEMLPLCPDANVLTREYLTYFLRSPRFVTYINEKTSGAKMPRANITDLKAVEVDCPSIDEQKRITKVFDEVTGIIKARQQQLQKLDELVKARFVEMFGDPERNPKKWPVVSITEIIRGKVSNGFFAKRDAYRNDGNVQVLGVANIVNRMYSNIEGLPRTNATQAEKEKYRVKYGDMLFCRSSLVAEGIGKASIVPQDTPQNVLFECHVIRLPLDQQKCVPEFVQALSTTPYFRKQIIAQSKTATMTTIGQDGILKAAIILPPVELQQEFLRFVEQTDKSKVAVQKALDEAQLLFDSLMQKYFQ